MKLIELIKTLPEKEVFNLSDKEIKEITYNSKETKPGSIFVCLKGERYDGHNFILEAVENKVEAIVYQDESKINSEIKNQLTAIKVPNTHQALAVLSSEFYHHPQKILKIIGVTGTNGKTTITFLLEKILRQAGFRTGLIGTLHIKISDQIRATKNTTPRSLDIFKIMAEMVKNQIEYLIIEVSSHGLDQDRVYNIPYDIAIYTNLTPEHLDYHKDMSSYFKAKLKMFTSLRSFRNSSRTKEPVAIINLDDSYASSIISETQAKVYTYGFSESSDFQAQKINSNSQGVSFDLKIESEIFPIKMNLLGLFNVYNALAAAAAAYFLGIKSQIIQEALAEIEAVHGRFEKINVGQNFTVVVDYSHTPDSLKNCLKTAKSLVKGKLIIVFGCGGDRDKTKRPIMGEIGCSLADICIITSDNPRTEPPENIIKQIQEGADITGKPYHVIIDRRQAIKKAINLAGKDDFVVIAGKGHEDYQILKDKTIHFSDFEEVEIAIKEKQKKAGDGVRRGHGT